MTVGADIAAALPELRAHAESMMVDSCVITGPGGEPVWDENAGEWSSPTSSTIYTGKCRLRMPRAAGSRADAGDASWAVDDAVLSLPIDGTGAIASGHVATITASPSDPSKVGLVLHVQAGHFQTDSTARRLPVKVVSRDA